MVETKHREGIGELSFTKRSVAVGIGAFVPEKKLNNKKDNKILLAWSTTLLLELCDSFDSIHPCYGSYSEVNC